MQLGQLLTDLLSWGGPLLLVGMVQVSTPSEGSDAELVTAVRQGDATAYRGLVERYQERIFTLVYGVVRDREEARDVTQDIFVRAFRSINSCREPARFKGWLLSIAMNTAVDATRRTGSRPSAGPNSDVILSAAAGETEGSVHEDTPGRRYEVGAMYQELLKVLDTLPSDQKQVLLLRELEGLSYREIAEITQSAEGTVMSRLYYARRRLREVLVRWEP